MPEATSVSAKDKTSPAKVHAEQRITALDGVRVAAIVLALLFTLTYLSWRLYEKHFLALRERFE